MPTLGELYGSEAPQKNKGTTLGELYGTPTPKSTGKYRTVGRKSADPIHFGTHGEDGVLDITENEARRHGKSLEQIAGEMSEAGWIAAIRKAGERGIKSNHIHMADPDLAPKEAARLKAQAKSNKNVLLPEWAAATKKSNDDTRKANQAKAAKKRRGAELSAPMLSAPGIAGMPGQPMPITPAQQKIQNEANLGALEGMLDTLSMGTLRLNNGNPGTRMIGSFAAMPAAMFGGGAVARGAAAVGSKLPVVGGAISKVQQAQQAANALPLVPKLGVGALEGIGSNAIATLPGGLMHGDFVEQNTDPLSLILSGGLGMAAKGLGGVRKPVAKVAATPAKQDIPEHVIQAWDQMNLMRLKQGLSPLDITNVKHHKQAIDYARNIERAAVPVDKALSAGAPVRPMPQGNLATTNAPKALPGPDRDTGGKLANIEEEISRTEASIARLEPLLERYDSMPKGRKASVDRAFEGLHNRLGALQDERDSIVQGRDYADLMSQHTPTANPYTEMFAPVGVLRPVRVDGRNAYRVSDVISSINSGASDADYMQTKEMIGRLIAGESPNRRLSTGYKFGELADDFMTPAEAHALSRATGKAFKVSSKPYSASVPGKQQAIPVVNDAAFTQPYTVPEESLQLRPVQGPSRQEGLFAKAEIDTAQKAPAFGTAARISHVKKRMSTRAAKLGTGPDPGLLYDAAELGYLYTKLGIETFEPWAARMVKELGEEIRPHLKNIWDKLNDGGDVEAAWQRIAKNPAVLTQAVGQNAPAQVAPIVQNTPNAPVVPDEPAMKLIDAMKQSRKTEPAKRQMFAEQRKQRTAAMIGAMEDPNIPNSEWAKRAKGALKGEFERPPIEFTDTFTAADWDAIQGRLRSTDRLTPYERLTVQDQLERLIIEGKQPEPRVYNMFAREFGPDFVKQLREVSPWWIRAAHAGWVEAGGLLRALQTTADMSWNLFQGIVTAGAEPKAWGQGFKSSVKAFFSDEGAKAIHSAIRNDPFYDTAQKAGLFIAEIGDSTHPAMREDPFVSRMLQKIPGIGHVVRASERAYATPGNVVRFNLLKRYAELAESIGKPYTDDELKGLAREFNVLTGRGYFGKAEPAGHMLSAPFYSLRNLAARIEQPFFMLHPEKRVRTMAVKHWVKFTGAVMGTLAAANYAGYDVETDPRSSDFAKIKIGDTRIDITGGYATMTRYIAQFLTGVRKNSDGSQTKVQPAKTLGNFLRSKAAPALGLGWSAIEGKDYVGNPVDAEHIPQVAANTLVPLALQDIMDAGREEGIGRAAWVAPATFFGLRTTTYEDKQPKTNSSSGGFSAPSFNMNFNTR